MTGTPIAEAFVLVRPDMANFEATLNGELSKLEALIRVMPDMAGFAAGVDAELAKLDASGGALIKVTPNVATFDADVKAAIAQADATPALITVLPDTAAFTADLETAVHEAGVASTVGVPVIPDVAGFDVALEEAVHAGGVLSTVPIPVIPVIKPDAIAAMTAEMQVGLTALTSESAIGGRRAGDAYAAAWAKADASRALAPTDRVSQARMDALRAKAEAAGQLPGQGGVPGGPIKPKTDPGKPKTPAPKDQPKPKSGGGHGTGLAVVAGATVYEGIKEAMATQLQTKILTDAENKHGLSLKANQPIVDATIKQGEKYGQTASTVEAALTKLINAGVPMGEASKVITAGLNESAVTGHDFTSTLTGMVRGGGMATKVMKAMGVTQVTGATQAKAMTAAQALLYDRVQSQGGVSKLTAAQQRDYNAAMGDSVKQSDQLAAHHLSLKQAQGLVAKAQAGNSAAIKTLAKDHLTLGQAQGIVNMQTGGSIAAFNRLNIEVMPKSNTITQNLAQNQRVLNDRYGKEGRDSLNTFKGEMKGLVATFKNVDGELSGKLLPYMKDLLDIFKNPTVMMTTIALVGLVGGLYVFTKAVKGGKAAWHAMQDAWNAGTKVAGKLKDAVKWLADGMGKQSAAQVDAAAKTDLATASQDAQAGSADAGALSQDGLNASVGEGSAIKTEAAVASDGLAGSLDAEAVSTDAAAVSTGILDAALMALPFVAIGAVVIALAVVIIKYHKQIWAFVKKVWEDIVKFIPKAWDAIFKTVKEAGEKVWGFLKKWGVVILLALTGPFGLAVGLLIKFHKQIFKVISEAWNAVIGFLKRMGSDILNAIKGAWNGAMSFIGGLVGDFYNFGKNIIMSLANGIIGAAKFVWNAVKSVAHGVEAVWNFVTGSHSPSKVYFTHGGELMQGLANGVTASKPLALAAMKGVAADLNKQIAAATKKSAALSLSARHKEIAALTKDIKVDAKEILGVKGKIAADEAALHKIHATKANREARKALEDKIKGLRGIEKDDKASRTKDKKALAALLKAGKTTTPSGGGGYSSLGSSTQTMTLAPDPQITTIIGELRTMVAELRTLTTETGKAPALVGAAVGREINHAARGALIEQIHPRSQP